MRWATFTEAEVRRRGLAFSVHCRNKTDQNAVSLCLNHLSGAPEVVVATYQIGRSVRSEADVCTLLDDAVAEAERVGVCPRTGRASD